MRIGELSERTGTSRRLLRYYEQQELIRSARRANGYRDYDERLVDRVLQIRGLLDAGMTTRIIKQILPCLGQPREIYVAEAGPDIVLMLEQQRDRMTRRAECLLRNRDAIAAYLEAVRGGAGAAEASTTDTPVPS